MPQTEIRSSASSKRKMKRSDSLTPVESGKIFVPGLPPGNAFSEWLSCAIVQDDLCAKSQKIAQYHTRQKPDGVWERVSN